MKWLLRIGLLLIVAALAFVHWILPNQVESTMNRVLPHVPYTVAESAAEAAPLVVCSRPTVRLVALEA